MSTHLILLLITLIVVFLIDLSGFIQEIEQLLSEKYKRTVSIRKPFSCSLCMTHWIGLIVLIATGEITLLNYLVLLTLAFFTSNIKGLLQWIKDILTKIEIILYRLVD